MGKRKSRYQSETEVPPHTQVLLHVTIDRHLNEEMRRIHDKEIEKAKDEDRPEPDWSCTCEMLCRKGVKAYRKERERVTTTMP